eukprot:m.299208 g.299208  ORF g.299208 m.299208 type:complete len:55 (+) comp20105_c0_seq1:2174-2338(+)
MDTTICEDTVVAPLPTTCTLQTMPLLRLIQGKRGNDRAASHSGCFLYDGMTRAY